MTNVTISGNSADDAGGAIYSESSGVPFSDPVAVFENTIVAGNRVGGMPTNCNRGETSEGHNLEDTDTCGLTAEGDLRNASAGLAALADNGGTTRTHALLAESAAIDSADSNNCPSTDQRGVARPLDGDDDGILACDIGSFEAQPQEAVTPTPTPGSTGIPPPTPPATAGPLRLPATGGRRESG